MHTLLTTLVPVFILLSLALAGLGIGWLLRGRELKGTCASQAEFVGETCPVCGKAEGCGGEPAAGGERSAH